MSDEESDLALPAIQLDNEQQRLGQVAHTDPIGLAWFGDNEAWIDKRTGGN